MRLLERIAAASRLGNILTNPSEKFLEACEKARQANIWFSEANIKSMVKNIASDYLGQNKLQDWASHYSIHDTTAKKIGIVAAGNIPLVVFHDVLSSFIAGHQSKIKLSQKDEFLLPALIDELIAIDKRVASYFEIVERIKEVDAVIATGSDNSSRYFHYYFDKYPNIIRKTRIGLGIITGEESDDELMALGQDVFQYFGLGCRNVSSLRVPRNYNFSRLLKLWEAFSEVRDNHAYNNNFDYNYALYIMNAVPHLSNDVILFVENENLVSRLATINYQYYDDAHTLVEQIMAKGDQLQVIVCHQPVEGLNILSPGKAQCPGLFDYADGVDTMQFLTAL